MGGSVKEPKKDMPRFLVRLPEELHRRAKVRCAELGTSMQRVLELLLIEWLKETK
jgi:predicted HicB family RNase H-like nuclease